ncbi:MAG: hypothetical protein ACK5L8_04935 [Marinicella pacifica]
MFYIKNDTGQSFAFKVLENNDVENTKFSVEFDLGWVTGAVISSCPEIKINNLLKALNEMMQFHYKGQQVKFINDGSVDIELSKNRTGSVILKGSLMPDMICDDQLEFSLEGIPYIDSK